MKVLMCVLIILSFDILSKNLPLTLLKSFPNSESILVTLVVSDSVNVAVPLKSVKSALTAQTSLCDDH